MATQATNNIKKQLLQGDVIEFTNESEQILLSFNSITRNFRITLNGTIIKINKRFSTFNRHATFLIWKKI